MSYAFTRASTVEVELDGDRSWRIQFDKLTESCRFLMEMQDNSASNDHVIEIPRNAETSQSLSSDRISSGMVASPSGERPLSIVRTVQPPTSSSNNNRNATGFTRSETRRRRSPLNSGLWISVELVITLSQIVASIVVLAVSRHERPHSPLRAWIVGYASGCCATLPLLYWRYCHTNVAEQETVQSRQNSTHINVPALPFSVSVSRASDGDDRRVSGTLARGGQGTSIMNARLKILVEYIKMALDCYFAVWFVVGNVWVFGGHTVASEAPSLYRLCIVFLAFSCIGYAMPFILCATFCCCLPCIISFLGLREDPSRGASSESINSLPTYKFKSNKSKNANDRDGDVSSLEGGVVAAGTERERSISGEDASCCICLTKYANNEELKELPCSHFFHKECVDKWLKINATCPLCKHEVGESDFRSLFSPNTSQ